MNPLWPRDPNRNLEYRLAIREHAAKDSRFRKQLIELCRSDVLFFVNTFCWLYEPRPQSGRRNVIPFCSHEYQDGIFLQIVESLGLKDIGVEKSRDLGLTWILLTVFFWKWLVAPKDNSVSFGLMSRNMDLVDKSGKTDTLFWKLDFLYWRLPKWMRPKMDRTHAQMTNLENASTIEGSPTTGDAFRGGRKTAIGMDEFHSFKPGEDYAALAATQHATDCRLFVSTPKGPSGAYYDVMHDTTKDMTRIVCDWKDHPTRRRGLYSTVNNEIGGKIEILDPDYRFPSSYPFVNDGKIRSPYYDRECKRAGATPQSIAQELDRDYGGAAATFFPPVEVKQHRQKHCIKPVHRGMLAYDPESLKGEFVQMGGPLAPLSIYVPLDSEGRPNGTHSYGIGCDISAGTGGDYSSNSCAAVMDAVSRDLVALFVSNTVRPDRFADLAMALGYFYSCRGVPAKLNWEANGIGSIFSNQVRDRAYPNVWYREVEQVNSKKKTMKPGWWSNTEAKNRLLGNLLRDFSSLPPAIYLRAEMVLTEMTQYIYINGVVEHSRSLTTQDESAKGRAHGDTVIAVALANEACGDIHRKVRGSQEIDDPPVGSMAWRLKKYDAALAEASSDWESDAFPAEEWYVR